jgi:cystathionine beta-lyase
MRITMQLRSSEAGHLENPGGDFPSVRPIPIQPQETVSSRLQRARSWPRATYPLTGTSSSTMVAPVTGAIWGTPVHWRTRLISSNARGPAGFRSLAPATYRGSTIVFDRLADASDDWHAGAGYTYGLYGTPTTLELGLRVAEIERARHSFVVPGGQAALALVYFAYCRTGSHALLPESAYGPNRELAYGLLAGLGVDVEAYDPLVGANITSLIRPNTALIWCESPGSITMEVQDVPAITAAAHARGVSVALDNTYAAGVLFDAFARGVDVSVQAITKYVGGHSDLLLGTVSVDSDEAYERVGSNHHASRTLSAWSRSVVTWL